MLVGPLNHLQFHLTVCHCMSLHCNNDQPTHTPQTLTTCRAELYRLCGLLWYDTTTPNETKISLIIGSAYLHASHKQGSLAQVLAPLWFGPLSPFVVIVFTQSLDSECKQRCAPAGKNTQANVNTHEHTPRTRADMHALTLRCKSSEDTSQSLKYLFISDK